MAVAVSLTKFWNYVATSTVERLAPFIADNATARIFALNALIDAGMQQEVPGGNELYFPVLKELQTAQAYSDLDPLDVSRADPTTVAKYNWKQLAVPVMISGRDMAINSGDDVAITRVMDLFVESAVLGLRDGLANSTTGIMSDNGESDKGITGLQNLITHTSNAAPTSGSPGGLDRSVYSFWRNQVADVADDFSANGITQMHTLYNACTRGDEKPDVIVLTRSTFNNYLINLQGTFTTNFPLTGSLGKLDAGKAEISFNDAILGFDDYTAADHGYFLNSRYLHYVVHPMRNIEMGALVKPSNQDALVGHMLFMGNLCMSNQARQGLLRRGDTN